jgi:hypothetical protein
MENRERFSREEHGRVITEVLTSQEQHRSAPISAGHDSGCTDHELR